MTSPDRVGFVGVHIGAGFHSESRTPTYLSICSSACAAAIEILRNGGSAIDAATEATKVLEDAGETNAGYGSNLTESRTIEMDAAIMDGSSLLFGSVGAIPGVKNPILVARKLVTEQNKGVLPLGRVPPLFMAGDGAREWASRHGIPTVPQESLISEKADKLYSHYKRKVDNYHALTLAKKRRDEDLVLGSPHASSSSGKQPDAEGDKLYSHYKRKADDYDELTPTKKIRDEESVQGSQDASSSTSSSEKQLDAEAELLDDKVSDTVGVVVMDSLGNVASTVSSGGIALKQPGRVGQASCFGCGCWAQNVAKKAAVAVSTTGCGEHIVRTFLAKETANSLMASKDPLVALQTVMKDRFAQSEFLSMVTEKLGASICLLFDPVLGHGEFLWTHTTSSLGLAFQTTSCKMATAKMSRLPDNYIGKRGTTVLADRIIFSAQLNDVASDDGTE